MRIVDTEPRGPLSMALSLRDHYTQEHCGRVEFLVAELARRCGYPEAGMQTLRDSARLHDVGKVGIPDSVLLKPGRLDAAEWTVMKTHAESGERICRKLSLPEAGTIALLVRCHHEHFDGGGYPDGLAGERIPLGARIIGVLDSYDAMTTPRSYKPSLSHAETMAVMRSERGRKSDPAVFDAFEDMMRDPRMECWSG